MIAVALAVVLIVAAIAAAFVPIEVRHSAPFGFSLTFDQRRLIAVRGGYVTANYDGFNRLDLDLRAYTAGERFDLTVHVRPAAADAPDVRTLSLSVTSEEIWHRKAAFANPFLTLRFPAIADSAGKRYYVWVEAGPRNRDAIWTVWSVKSYSRVPAREVLAALVETPPEPLPGSVGGVVLILLIAGTVGTAAWLLAAVAAAPDRESDDEVGDSAARSVAAAEG